MVEDELEDGLDAVEALVAIAEKDRREPSPLSELVVGLKCGGSDGFSGVTANPWSAASPTRSSDAGGTPVLTEIPEVFGAEGMLLARAATREVFDEAVEVIERRRWDQARGARAFSWLFSQPGQDRRMPALGCAARPRSALVWIRSSPGCEQPEQVGEGEGRRPGGRRCVGRYKAIRQGGVGRSELVHSAIRCACRPSWFLRRAAGRSTGGGACSSGLGVGEVLDARQAGLDIVDVHMFADGVIGGGPADRPTVLASSLALARPAADRADLRGSSARP